MISTVRPAGVCHQHSVVCIASKGPLEPRGQGRNLILHPPGADTKVFMMELVKSNVYALLNVKIRQTEIWAASELHM